eukprot:CAMPEP_0171353814 /NCGR_PEP_ID=MMETSP0878-20121228/44384_1 /TAXON_ID=67004 /ORGANISM="Thalassiosira weissflogii, Strain CCMP1336" /LENGTH=230 /DNA_ID=CAMNT_0011859771 /DNA_START=1472 /DNA_END=2164 /DNA_ORIENTATION=+
MNSILLKSRFNKLLSARFRGKPSSSKLSMINPVSEEEFEDHSIESTMARIVFDDVSTMKRPNDSEEGIDVHLCNSLMCTACNRKESIVTFVKVNETDRCKAEAKSPTTASKDPKPIDKAPSPGSTALTSPSTSSFHSTRDNYEGMTTNIIPPKILFENISAVGVIRGFRAGKEPKTKEGEQAALHSEDLSKPYEMTRSKSFSDDEESLKLFVEKIESMEEDVDVVMFGQA